MHIPDGYLSPQTALPVFAGMLPVWGAAFRKVKKLLDARRTPMLAVCAAFSFIIMMFNVPVAGGSSAHAVGAVFVAVLLGPWAACISVSSALFIQALVFGDGGIVSLGVNCLNMAVIMPFTGWAVWRLIRGGAPAHSRRSLAGAAVGGYIGINLAALAAAFEFGIQPLLFHTAGGAPLYCPYGLSVAVPAMALTHLLVAGPIEAVVTAAGIGYLARFAPHLFAESSSEPVARQPFFRRWRVVLIPLAALIVLSPLGLLAQGTAWGEWSGEELKSAFGQIPSGFERFSDWWHALLPDYSLPALGGSAFGSTAGYILSAVTGIVLIGCLSTLTARLMRLSKKKQG